MKLLMALMAGLVFGLGLILSGMTNPSKVLAFLDLTGNWDPSLAFVMGGALVVGSLAFPLAAKWPHSLLGETMRLPKATKVDRRLVLGGLTFGVGWGLAGYCPGPVLASLLLGGSKPLMFFGSMIAGMLVFEVLERIRPQSS
ncbi:YeeE/YedE family protein [Pollutimonas bauzanensis]|uniref:YeeE/YedE family protein n=1 Tax=Pollutimonas bauzanensis TaxID=658167 RepID=UPI00333F60E9